MELKTETLNDAIAATRTGDVSVVYACSITQLFLNTPVAHAWVQENVETEDWQWMGNALCIDSRFVDDVVHGMRIDGLEVR